MSQSQHKQLQEGGVYEQVLIVTLKLGEAGQPLCPAPCGLHRDGEQPVEEVDVFYVRGGGWRVGSAELQIKNRREITERTCKLFVFVNKLMHFSS